MFVDIAESAKVTILPIGCQNIFNKQFVLSVKIKKLLRLSRNVHHSCFGRIYFSGLYALCLRKAESHVAVAVHLE